jgi:hypothetical protein
MKTSVALLSLSVAVLPAITSLAQEANRRLENVTGDVWQFTNDSHQSAVVVTDDGIVVTDPINADAAEWLKAEIAEQFGRPITHLIYSHSHGDHASGGEAFGDVTAIAQADAPKAIDGVEIDRRIDEPTTVELGGKTLELVPLGPGHGTDMLVMVVRPENVAFVVDVVSPGRVPLSRSFRRRPRRPRQADPGGRGAGFRCPPAGTRPARRQIRRRRGSGISGVAAQGGRCRPRGGQERRGDQGVDRLGPLCRPRNGRAVGPDEC